MTVKIALLILVIGVLETEVSGTDLKPTACTERLSHVPGHSACLQPSSYLNPSSPGINESDKNIIVAEHNKYRNSVTPPATNMLKMYWDEELSLIAQAWANNCQVKHDNKRNRNIPGVYQVGQNIAWDFETWTKTIQAWNAEVKDFTYNGTVDAPKVGHYTQLVWADSTRVGCGLAVCYSNSTRFFVCNYGPAGNRGGYNQPYKNGSSGAECGSKEKNLCDCGGKACENGGTLNRTSCTCTCIVENRYVGDFCKLDCEDLTKTDPSYCNDPNQPPYMPEGCDIYADTPDRCPRMCGNCPYGDYRYDFNASKFVTPDKETTKRPPRVCQDKYMIQGGHTACLQPSDKLDPDIGVNMSSTDIHLIVAKHNRYRGSVVPQATNMLALSWDPEIAMIAQVWAEHCDLTSDDPNHRNIPGRFELGQNIAIGVNNWTDAIKTWKRAGEKFVYGKQSADTAKYTQLMWASTSRVGCGYAECDGEKFYVCNYGPSGNTRQDNSKPYVNGSSCSACSGHCPGNKLCDCGKTSCENGGIMDLATCTCSCKAEFYKSSGCLLTCDDVTEPALCYKAPFQVTNCASSVIVQTFCPNMCKVCPYADPKYVETGVTSPPPLTTTPGHRSGHDQIGAAGRPLAGENLVITSLLVMTAVFL